MRLPRPSRRALRRAAAPLRALRAAPAPLRRTVIALGAVLVLAGSGWLWFRDSSFVAVEEASVSGLTTPDAPRLRAALTAAARDMSTLHVRVEELEKAVSPFPVVKEVRAEADFPHGLRIEVVEHRPVALAAGGEGEPPVALADDGTLLRRLTPERNLRCSSSRADCPRATV